jgi:serine/threonine protein kinase
MTGCDFGPYLVGEKLGQGGMGEVFKAEDRLLGRVVALKFLSRHHADPTALKRFIREAQACAALSHPNVCDLYHVIEEGGKVCLVMAYVDGGTLAQRLKQQGVPLAHALDLTIQVAAGLAEAHNKKIVHRDIKPANILLTSQGQAKITDFGIALLQDRSRLTKTGDVVGTPHYMSPEQAVGHVADRRSDIWSLAVVLCEMIAGELPFRGPTLRATIEAILYGDPDLDFPLPQEIRDELRRILRKALAKKPEER